MDPEEQKQLNKPLAKSDGIGEENEKFLAQVMELVDGGKINLYGPSSIINTELYDKLNEDRQGQVDLEAINLLSGIREMADLYHNGYKDSFQMENLVERIRLTKERLEFHGGDLYII